MSKSMTVSYFDAANKLKQEGRFEEAIASYRSAIEENPNFYWSYQNLGDVLFKVGRWEEAVNAYSQAIELNPSSAWIYYNQGEAFAQLGRLDDAIACYEKALELSPDEFEIHYGLAEALRLRNDRDLAQEIAMYKRLIKLNPDSSVEAYKNLLKLQPNNWEMWGQLADIYSKQNQKEEAIACYQQVISFNSDYLVVYEKLTKLQPSNWENWYVLGEKLEGKGETERAIACYQQVISLNPEYLVAYEKLTQLQPSGWENWYVLGEKLEAQGETERAIACYQQVISLNPEYLVAYEKLTQLQPSGWENWYVLGEKLEAQGEMERAIACYQQVISLNPEYLVAYEKLTQLQPSNWENWYVLGEKLEGKGEIERAIDVYQKIILNLNAKAESNFQIGRSLAQNDQLEQGVHRYEEAISINPILVKISAQLGSLFLGQKKYDKAIQSYERLIEIQPDHQEALYQLVILHRINNNLEKAIIHSQRLKEINPNSPKNLFIIGNLSLTQGKPDEAMSYYHKAAKIKCSKIKKSGKFMPILISSMPKSGTVYIEENLRNGLQISSMRELKFIRTGASEAMDIHLELGFPEVYYSDVYGILVDHLNASEWNLLAINVIVDKLLVNVRDPRQSLISWISHFNRYSKITDHQVEFSRNFKYSQHYLCKNYKEEIDYQIQHGFLPYSVKWIEGWLDAQENSLFKPKILFTKFEDLATNPKTFFEQILDFYEIEKSRFVFPELPKFKEGTHFRKGRTDEWREVFTPEQKEKATKMIPQRLLDKFQWPTE